MALRNILTLDTSIAPRLIRCLYIVALILIAVMVILGLARGVRVMTFQPPPRPAAASNQAAPDAQAQQPGPQQPGPGMMRQGLVGPGQMGPGMMGPGQRQFMRQMMARRFGPRRPFGPFGIGRNPVLGGLLIMLGALLRGAIALLVVRILAEIGLAILAMPRRSET